MSKPAGFRIASSLVPFLALASAFPAVPQDDALEGGAELASSAICPACGAASWILADGFETGSSCRWSARSGSSEVCGATCGDCSVISPEVCDDGNTLTETGCPYGTSTCQGCSAACDQILELTGGYCGDGVPHVVEECDDGNTVTEVECEYGNPVCQVCAFDCTLVSATGPVCGDHIVDLPFETCDDGNTLACGTCSANCQTAQGNLSSGFIAVVDAAEIVDTETLTIDETLLPSVTFEFDKNGLCCAGNNVAVPIAGGANEPQVGSALAAAIDSDNGFVLFVNASAGAGSIVQLTYQFPTSLGNFPIAESVADPGFVATALTGGQAGDCFPGTGCAIDADCASFACVNFQCN